MKYKSFFALLLAAAIIIAGAVLPMLVAKVQDSLSSKQAGYAPMNAVSLEFEESGLTMQEKLALGSDADTSVEIPGELASRTAEEVLKLAAELIAPYQEAGLLHGEALAKSQPKTCTPVLLYMKSESQRSNIFWIVTAAPMDRLWDLYLVIDDETGRLCTIEYTANTSDLAYLPITGSRKDQLMKLCEIYLSGLGDEFSEFDQTTLVDNSWTTANDNGLSTRLNGGDDVQITLHVGTYGFSAPY